MVAVPSRLLTKLRCFGSFPTFEIFGTGAPSVVIVNEKDEATVPTASSGLVIAPECSSNAEALYTLSRG